MSTDVQTKAMNETTMVKDLGPNADAVNRLIEQASQITAVEAEKLNISWSNANLFSLSDARDAATNAGRFDALDAAQIAVWDATLDAEQAADALDVEWFGSRASSWAAVQAVVVRDLLTPETYALLAGPWESVMGTVDDK